jgi:hypothetical protein
MYGDFFDPPQRSNKRDSNVDDERKSKRVRFADDDDEDDDDEDQVGERWKQNSFNIFITFSFLVSKQWTPPVK